MRIFSWWCFIVLLVVSLVRGAVIWKMPLSPDEAYYWLWAQHLAWGYLDHPAMVAWWIKISTTLLGQNVVGIRILGVISGVLSTIMLACAAQDFFGVGKHAFNKQELAAKTIYLSLAVLGMGVGAVTMTPDTPLLFFLCCSLWPMGRLMATEKGWWWIVIGGCLGLALESKYTAFLWCFSVVLWLVLTKVGRRWLFTVWPWLGAAVCMAVFTPTLWWNSQHQWASFIRQGGRAASWEPTRMLKFLTEFMAGQIGLLTPVIFIGSVLGCGWLWKNRKENKGFSLLLWLIMVPVGVFLQHAVGDRVQANWPMIVYPLCIITLAAYPWKGLKAGIITGFIITALVYVQAGWAIFPLPRSADITMKRLAGWPTLARQLNATYSQTRSRFIAIDDYGVAALMAFYLPDTPIIGVDARWRYFNMSHCVLPGQGLFMQSTHRRTLPMEEGLKEKGLKMRIDRKRGDAIAEQYNLYYAEFIPNEKFAVLSTHACLTAERGK